MEIRDLTPADLDAIIDIRRRAFGTSSPAAQQSWRGRAVEIMSLGRYLGCFDGTRLTATTRIHDLRQWWYGRAVSMGGLASVAVAPEDRGRGIGRRIVAAALHRCHDLGHPISVLYPATTPLYRGLGWEHAASLPSVTLPAEALRTLPGPSEPVKVRRAGSADADEIVATVRRVHEMTSDSGPIEWPAADWRQFLDDDDFVYLAEDGVLVYRLKSGVLEVDNLIAGSEATARALWGIVGSGSSIAKTVKASVAPDDPLLWMLRERSYDEVKQARWMLRLIDLPAAIAGRGFPRGTALDTVVAIEDPLREANIGAWRLRVADGRGTAEPADSGAVHRLGIGGMAALYAGVPATTLRRSGLLSGDTGADGLLDAAFAAKPYLLDYF